MHHHVAVAALAFLFVGCVSTAPQQNGMMHTLGARRDLPTQDIEKLFGPSEWSKLRDLEYEAVVVMTADVRADGSLRLGRVRESFPDASWQALAKSFASDAELRAASVGSHIDPKAEVVVIFFKRALDGNLALIFARQAGEPAPGMASRALFLHTRRYERD